MACSRYPEVCWPGGQNQIACLSMSHSHWHADCSLSGRSLWQRMTPKSHILKAALLLLMIPIRYPISPHHNQRRERNSSGACAGACAQEMPCPSERLSGESICSFR